MSTRATSSRASVTPPPQLRIQHRKYTVDLLKEDVEVRGQPVCGYTDNDERKIAIDIRQPRDAQQEVLIHEILHACFGTAVFRLESEEEEYLVDRLSGPILSFIRDNPDHIKFLTKE